MVLKKYDQLNNCNHAMLYFGIIYNYYVNLHLERKDLCYEKHVNTND